MPIFEILSKGCFCGVKNSYEEALVDVGVVLSRYDEDNNYAVFGFGGQPGKLNLSKSQTISPRLDEIEEVEVAEETAEVPAEETATGVLVEEESIEVPAEEESIEVPAEEESIEVPAEEKSPEVPAEVESPEVPAEEDDSKSSSEDEEEDSSSDSSIESRRDSSHSPQEEVQIEKNEESPTEAMSPTAAENPNPEKEELSVLPSVELRRKPVSPPPRSTFTRTFLLLLILI